jgi:transposase
MSSNARSNTGSNDQPTRLLPPSAIEAAGLYLSGMEIPQIANLMRSSEQAVLSWLKRQGVRLRRRKVTGTTRHSEQSLPSPTTDFAAPLTPSATESVQESKSRISVPGSGRGRPRLEIPPTRQALIASAYQAGQSIAVIAERFGYSYSAVRRMLAEHGITIRRVGSGAKRTVPASRLEEVRRLRQAGLTTQQIAEEFQVPLRTAYYWLSKTAAQDQ